MLSSVDFGREHQAIEASRASRPGVTDMMSSFEIFSSRTLRNVRLSWSERLLAGLASFGSQRLTAVNPEEWTRHMRRDVGLPEQGPTERPVLPSRMPRHWPRH
jgi:hypothetical protein